MTLHRTLPWLFTAIILGACQQKPPAQAEGPPPTPVQIAKVGQGSVTDSSELVASLKARQSAVLKPQVSGQVKQVFVQLGDRVGSGELILRIDPAVQKAALDTNAASIEASQASIDTARANLRSAQAERLNRKADLDYKQSLYDRQASLYKEGAISKDRLDQYERDLTQAKASISVQDQVIQSQQSAVVKAERDLQKSRADANQTQVQMGFFQVTAPFAGTVGDVLVKPGDYVTPDTTLTTVSQNQPLEVMLSIPLDRLPQIKIGTPIQLLNSQGKSFATTQVSFVSPQADPATQAVMVKALYDNSQGLLRADQLLRTRVVWQQKTALVIPLTAVSRVAGQNFVYTVKPAPSPQPGKPPGSVASQIPVQLGALEGNQYQVISGLTLGQSIVTSGLQKLYPDAPIMDETLMKPPSGGSAPKPAG